MKSERPSGDCCDESARLLAWFVNGTLGPDESACVRRHLERCATCRADADHLQTMQSLLRVAPSVEHTPQAGLRKLMARVDQEIARDAAASAVTSAAKVPATPRAKTIVPWRGWAVARSPVHWLAVAVVVQACAIVAMVGTGLVGVTRPSAPAVFRTLTSAGTDGPRLRVLFAPTMTLAELQDLLRANRLAALGGPSDTGLFTLALQAPESGEEAQAAVVARLRADARVRFAEAVRIESMGRLPR